MELFLEQFPIVVKALNAGFLQTLKLFAVTQAWHYINRSGAVPSRGVFLLLRYHLS